MTPEFDPFTPILSFLPRSARAAYGAIRGLALRQPLETTTKILEELASVDIRIRRQTALDLIAIIRNKADVPRFERQFGQNAIIPDELHTLGPVTFSGGARVQYLVEITSSNPLTPGGIYVNSETNLTVNQILGKAIASFRYEEGSGLSAQDVDEVTQFKVVDARYAPGLQRTGEFRSPE